MADLFRKALLNTSLEIVCCVFFARLSGQVQLFVLGQGHFLVVVLLIMPLERTIVYWRAKSIGGVDKELFVVYKHEECKV